MAEEMWFAGVARTFERLGWAAIVGVLLLASSRLLGEGRLFVTVMILGFCLFIPWFIYVYLLTVWHWKDRYRGDHNRLWGALLLVETSGWFKIVYWYRHIVPDWRGTGRYRRSDTLLAPPGEKSA